MIVKCELTGVPFKFEPLIPAARVNMVHPQIRMHPQAAFDVLKALAELDLSKPYNRAAVHLWECRLRLCGLVYATDKGLLDSIIRPADLLVRCEPAEEYVSSRELKGLTVDAASLLALAGMSVVVAKSRELYTGMWTSKLGALLEELGAASDSLESDLSYAGDSMVSDYLKSSLGLSQFVTPHELRDHLNECLPYTELGGDIPEVFNTLYTGYQMAHLPEDSEAVVNLLLRLDTACRFLQEVSVDRMMDAITEGRKLAGVNVEWKIGKALFKAASFLRKYEPDHVDEPTRDKGVVEVAKLPSLKVIGRLNNVAKD